MKPTNDEQLSKLPKYASDEIVALRRQVDSLKSELVAQQGATPTKVKWGWELKGEAFGYLKDDETVFFSVPRGRYMSKIRVTMKRDQNGININADGTLVIECGSSNDCTIRLKQD